MAKKIDNKPKRKSPVKYSEEVFNELCELIATSSIGIDHICRNNPHLPNPKSFYQWINEDKIGELSKKYARARERQAHFMASEIIAISDDSKDDDEVRFTAAGEAYTVENKEWTSRSKLRVDSRKWLMSKLLPKVYGDKIDVTTQGDKITTPVIIDWGTNPNNANSETKGSSTDSGQ